jgi:hypothetical protein
MRHLAQANVARQRAPLSSPEMGELVVAAQSEPRASVAAWPAVVVRRRNPARRVSSSSL